VSPAPAAPTPAPIGALGVPETARAFLLDLDGVLTQTAKQHAAAWKLVFDDFLAQRAQDTGETFVPFASGAEYETYVDGKRRIQLLTATPDDLPGAPTLHGLSNRKNALVLELISVERVTVYVIGVNRVGQAAALRTHGTEVVVSDLVERLDRP
jgi:beta-phosphoglucomutase-like phosphatase (HAD superfamily)